MNNSNVCYWCGKKATTREHVPPKSLFPSKTFDNKRWDKLITVPSCEEHNSAKGQFDEYLRNHVVIASNTRRAYENTRAVVKSFFRNDAYRRTVQIKDGGLHFDISDENICFSLESIARALYFHEREECFVGVCDVYYGGYSSSNGIARRNNMVLDFFVNKFDQWSTPPKGAYPDVFFYQFGFTDWFGCTPLLLRFYEAVNVVIILRDKEHESLRTGIPFQESVQTLLEMGIDPFAFHLMNQGYNGLEEDEKGVYVKDQTLFDA